MTLVEELDALQKQKAALEAELEAARGIYRAQADALQAKADALDDRINQIRAAATDASGLKTDIERRSNRPPLLRKS